jgi:hypothetical protein
MCVVHPPFGRAQWRRDPHFELQAHVRTVELPPPRDRRALQALVSRLMSTPLERSRPLWQVHVIERYEGGTALLFRIHHAIADGFSLLRVMLSLTDGPEGPSLQPPGRASYPSLLPVAIGAEGRGFLSSARELSREPARAMAMMRLGVSGLGALGRLLALRSDPATALKGPLGVSKQAAWSEPIALSALKEAGQRAGATLAGRPIRRIMFWVPQSGRLGLGFSIFSYAGEVVLGVAADAALVGDADELVDGCVQELQALSGRSRKGRAAARASGGDVH